MFEKTFYEYKCPVCGNVEIHYAESATDKWACTECSKTEKVSIMTLGDKADKRNFLTG